MVLAVENMSVEEVEISITELAAEDVEEEFEKLEEDMAKGVV